RFSRDWSSDVCSSDLPLTHLLIIPGLAVALAGCTTGMSPDAPGLEPIPGSITYGGQPRTRLMKSPVGSSVHHQFRNNLGQRVEADRKSVGQGESAGRV